MRPFLDLLVLAGVIAYGVNTSGRATCSTEGRDIGWQSTGNTRGTALYSADSLRRYLGRDLDDLKASVRLTGIEARDTMLEGENGVTWRGLSAIALSGPLFLAETGWLDTIHTKRITLLSPSVVTREGIHVGMRFADARRWFSRKIPSFPDGYFGLHHRNDSRQTFFFSVDEASPLWYGVGDFTTIPDTLRILEIMLE